MPKRDIPKDPRGGAERATTAQDMSKAYGYESVEPTDKQDKVDGVFHSVAREYDIMNDLMSLGVHRLWKDALVAKANLPKSREWHSLDIAGGSGDIAFRLLDGRPQGRVSLSDINASMLDQAKERAKSKNLENQLDFTVANAEQLPFADNSFDCCTIAFGIRNVPRMDKALEECLRVLKPAGQFLCLEFSQPDVPFLDKLYDYWSFNVIPKWGKAIANDEASYQYLVESIRKFPSQRSFATMIEQAGFKRVDYRNMSGGIVALHWGWKI